MFTRILPSAGAVALAMGLPVHAQNASPPAGAPSRPIVELPAVVVTGNPLGSELFNLVTPASVLGGSELLHRMRSTIGETLDGLPGVSASSFGPNASRPVIRGLDNDRIRILQNGGGVIDASSLSNDHAVTVDPIVVDRLEVVRGPAALLYGGSAVGGVVNALDNRIPVEGINGIGGRAEFRYGGAEREKSGGVVVEIGNGRFNVHADAYARDTDDLAIKGTNISARQRASGAAVAVPLTPGHVPNSNAVSNGGALGASYTWTNGYVGLSQSQFATRYGTVAEPAVVIDMDSMRWDLAGEVRELDGAITGVRFKAGQTQYRHAEIDAGAINTRFNSHGYEARIEASHAKVGPLKGAFGIQTSRSHFSALGAEAFVPSTHSDANALFVYEEMPIGPLKISFGGRHERSEVRSDGGGPIDPGTLQPRFNPGQSRTFSGSNGSLGAAYPLTRQFTLAVNAAYTERAPTFYELFANGPHAATGSYEVGNAAFGKERSKAFDAALKFAQGAHTASIGVFRNRFENFISLFNSGNQRGADGELNPVDADGDGVADGSGENITPELQYRAVPATFQGYELEGKFRIGERAGTTDLLLRYDQVRAEDRSTGRPLPRIAPQRFGASLVYQAARLGGRLDMIRVEGQSRLAAGELATDGYTMVNATVSYRMTLTGLDMEAFLRGTNLLNEEARNHVSFLKDIAPLGRRSMQVGLRGRF